MQQHDGERARYLLEAALRRLDEAREAERTSEALPAPPPLSSESIDSGAPVILVVLGDLNSGSHKETSPRPLSAGETEYPPDSPASNYEKKLSHPGLERFTMVKSDLHPPVPKACFMEPTRKCVNSGACEMRGF